MLVRTPAMKLAVEIRSAGTADGRIRLEGVANSMPCSVEIGAAEALGIVRAAMKRDVLRLLARALLRRGDK